MLDGDVRLEYKPFPNKSVYLDLWLPGVGVAVELKYFTRKLEHEHNGESFALRDQAAQDIRRYDFMKDIQRLERVSKERGEVRSGFAVLLTNDPSYWQQPSRSNTVDAAFRLQGRPAGFPEKWLGRSARPAETTKGREEAIHLDGSYELQWRDYADIGGVRHGQLRYLAAQNIVLTIQDQACRPRSASPAVRPPRTKLLPIESFLQYRFATPKPLRNCGRGIVAESLLCATRHANQPAPGAQL